jgi:hypothetical protein
MRMHSFDEHQRRDDTLANGPERPPSPVRGTRQHEITEERRLDWRADDSRAGHSGHGDGSRRTAIDVARVVYVAVKQYDPRHFARSRDPQRELPLKAGDLVHTLGLFRPPSFICRPIVAGCRMMFVSANNITVARVHTYNSDKTVGSNPGGSYHVKCYFFKCVLHGCFDS